MILLRGLRRFSDSCKNCSPTLVDIALRVRHFPQPHDGQVVSKEKQDISLEFKFKKYKSSFLPLAHVELAAKHKGLVDDKPLERSQH